MKRWILLIPLFLALLVHAPAIRGDFVWDDAIVTKRQVFAFKSLEDVFFPPEQIPQWAQNYYRPMIVATYLLDQQLFEPNATVGPHLTNIFFHVVVTLFVYLFAMQCLRNLPRRRWGACIAAILFAVHPIHTESVSWITGRSDTVAALFLVPSLVVAILYRDRGAWWQLILAPVLFLLAALSKEVALSAIIVLPLVLWLVPKEKTLPTNVSPPAKAPRGGRRQTKKGERAKEHIKAPRGGATGVGPLVLLYFLYILATIIYFVLRQKAHIGYGSSWQPGFAGLVARAWDASGYYVLKTLMPYPQLHFVPPEYLPGTLTASLILIASGTAFGVGMKYWHSGRPLLIFSLGWFLVTLSPSLVVAVRSISETPVAERYLYLPSLSLALILGGLTCLAMEKGYRKIAVTVALLVILGYGVQTGLRAAIWTDNIKLWSDATRKAPDHCLPWNELAQAYYKEGDRDQSQRCIEKALQVNCDPEGRSISHNNLGSVYGHRGEWERAEFHFKEAIQERAQYASPYYGLGSIALMKSNQAKSAEDVRRHAKEGVNHFNRAVQLNPHYTKAMWGLVRCHTTLGGLAEQAGDGKEAIREYEIASNQLTEMIRIDPQHGSSNPAITQALDKIGMRIRGLK